MAVIPAYEAPKWLLVVLNSLYEAERKLSLHGDAGNVMRNLERIKETLKNEGGVFFEDPMGEAFSETRTDLEATISGETAEDLVVVEVIKPIVRFGNEDLSRVVQRGIVVVKAQTKGELK